MSGKTSGLGRLLAIASVAAMATTVAACSKTAEFVAAPDRGLLPPVVNPLTKTNEQLRALSPPTQPIAVAVYNYEDQTGQFEKGAGFQTISKAVTQGGASVLIKALQDAGLGRWFTVIERENLNNLLQERKIIADMRKIYLNETVVNRQALPPLLFAGILLDGGIVGFDTNSMTGGLGARLLGIGGSAEYREDTVTVYLRGISTKTGEVLLSTVAHKKILSYGIQGGAFKFIEFDELLEAEAGVTKNEPKQLAVQQAVEKVLLSFIAEGAARNLWQFEDKQDQADLIRDYGLIDVASLHLPPELVQLATGPQEAAEAAAAAAAGRDATGSAALDLPAPAPVVETPPRATAAVAETGRGQTGTGEARAPDPRGGAAPAPIPAETSPSDAPTGDAAAAPSPPLEAETSETDVAAVPMGFSGVGALRASWWSDIVETTAAEGQQSDAAVD